jgi:hypothetical protein
MTTINEMWQHMTKHQRYATEHGYGVVWAIMCERRTESSAWDVVKAVSMHEDKHPPCVAWAVADAARAINSPFERLSTWTGNAIEYLRQAENWYDAQAEMAKAPELLHIYTFEITKTISVDIEAANLKEAFDKANDDSEWETAFMNIHNRVVMMTCDEGGS